MFEHYFSADQGKPTVQRLQEHSRLNEQTGCIEWTGKPTPKGYGQMKVPDGKGGWRGARPNRVAWELAYGPIPEGRAVCHHCDNRLCVNPEHMFIGSDADNMADRDAKGRQARGERQWKAVLTAPKVVVMRAAFAHGVKAVTLARAFGISEATVGAVITRRTWKHLP